ncbi:hypothetical protein Tco_0553660 [Tanacetum coccineum]
MVPPNNLGPDLNGKSVNKTQYRGMIGSLMYLTASRPDIQFSTCLCARYQANPKESHLIVVKRIFRYLKGCNMDRKSTLVLLQSQTIQSCTQEQSTLILDITSSEIIEPTFKILILELGMLNIDSKPEASALTEEN